MGIGHAQRTTTRLAAPAIAAILSACHSGPPAPADYLVTGEVATSQDARFEVEDVYAWRPPQGDAVTVLLSDRPFPTLTDDAWPVTDLTLLITWTQSPHAELVLDERGELVRVFGSGGGRGSSSAPCSGNPGACSSSVSYLGQDAIDASYEFRNEYDLTLVRPVHRQSNAQLALTQRMGDAPQRETAVQHEGDHDRMAERYTRVRAALDAGTVDAFLAANGYGQPTLGALASFDGLGPGVMRLANGCPRATSFEAFGNDGSFGSLIVKYDGGEKAVYFLRRGDEWLLHSCGE